MGLLHWQFLQIIHIFISFILIAIMCGGKVSQSKDAESKSLMLNLCHLQPLTSEEEGHAYCPTQVVSLIDPFSLLIQEKPYVSDTQLDQTGDFRNSHFTGSIFTHTSSDYPTYLSVHPTRPLEFSDPPLECLGTHEEVEALQLLLMVMSSSHVPDETLEPSQIRVSKIRVSTHHAPLNITSPDVRSS